ncbi:fumarylacetoacetate hydrolase family protein [soil metagenome]
MRVGNIGGRAVLVVGDRALDIAEASGGRFPTSPRSLLEHWDEVLAWAPAADWAAALPFEESSLDAPIPNPDQVFAIGLNYKDHADEAGLPYPEHLVVFTKFQSSIGAPNTAVELPSGDVDYETELVVIIGKAGHKILETQAWSHVAGVSVGQDYSERVVQRRGPAPQFSLGKSYPNFTPYGPVIVSLDELTDPDALSIIAELEHVDGTRTTVQNGTSAHMIFSVPRTIADLSQIVTLHPGDLIFTGTPAGVGLARGFTLQPGQALRSTIEGVGSIRNAFVAAS